ncbi:MAG: SnoaL-like domain-containing protein [Bacteroidota bacterium]
MNVKEIANDLVKHCRLGQYEEVVKKYYSPAIRSIEPASDPQEVQGIEAIIEKGKQWEKDFEVHGLEISDPVVADDYFSCVMAIDSTHRPSGQRSTSSEVCVYEVKDGKIVMEQFFYKMPTEM